VNDCISSHAQVVKQLNTTPENALAIELNRLLLLLEQLDNLGKLAGGHKYIDILDWPAVAIEMSRDTRADAPLHLIAVEQPLNDP
jgi:hypothetical protein